MADQTRKSICVDGGEEAALESDVGLLALTRSERLEYYDFYQKAETSDDRLQSLRSLIMEASDAQSQSGGTPLEKVAKALNRYNREIGDVCGGLTRSAHCLG